MRAQSSGSELSAVSVSHHHGFAPPADNSSPLQSAVSEEAERRTAEEEQTEAIHQQPTDRVSNDDAEQTSDTQEDPVIELSRAKRKAYKRLVQREVRDAESCVQAGVEELKPSQIGDSRWTETEKEAFFAVISRFGQDDLPRLAQVIPTKSQFEVRQYLLVLRAAAQLTSSSIDLSSVPASAEISSGSEKILDRAALNLSERTFLSDVEKEKERFGDDWLVDEELAEQIEAELDGSGGTQASTSDGDVHENATGSTTSSVPPSLELVLPAPFLELSRSIFMNSNDDSNWQRIDAVSSDVSSTPAIFRSAFDDLYILAVELTRRLVHATILQATSRIRANSESHPASQVIEDDARTAINLLCIPEWRPYWVKVTHRCGVDVYSEAKCYKDGRPGTKTGVKLTASEVERALALGEPELDEANALDIEARKVVNTTRNGVGFGNLQNDDGMTTSDSDEDEEKRLEAFDAETGRFEEKQLLFTLGVEKDEAKKPDREPTLGKRKEAEDDGLRMDWRKRTKYEAEWEWEARHMSD
jgi:RNA polymerase I-specific transcription initiation factor RRN5